MVVSLHEVGLYHEIGCSREDHLAVMRYDHGQSDLEYVRSVFIAFRCCLENGFHSPRRFIPNCKAERLFFPLSVASLLQCPLASYVQDISLPT